MKTHYVLIDFENVQVKSLALIKDEHFRVYVFLGPNNAKLPVDLVIAMQSMGARATYIVLEKPGNNALDFHIAYYLGVLSKEDPAGYFHIISKDSGFDPLIQHLRKIKIVVSRSALIEDIPFLTAVTPPLPLANPISQPPLPVPHVTHKEPDQAVTATPPNMEAMVKTAMTHLIKQKTARPRTHKTLLNSLHAKCGKDVTATQIEAIFQTLVQRGYVKLEGTRVVYGLPAA
ncbi:MAG: PIN domain-containing protein [bacterium]